MEHDTVRRTLREFLLGEFPNQAMKLEDDTHLLNDWFVDSLGIIEMVMFIETQFGVAVGRADINAQNFETIDTLARFVVARAQV